MFEPPVPRLRRGQQRVEVGVEADRDGADGDLELAVRQPVADELGGGQRRRA